MEDLWIDLNPDGTVSFLHDDRLTFLHDLGDVDIIRASHVEYQKGEGWYADMYPISGPRLTGFRLREDAMAAERRWIHDHT